MIGQTLGHYRIDARLGAGGMGVVYRAHDTRLERTVAVKLIGEEIPADDTARQRLLSEARSASALNHPHVCTVHEVGEADGHIFIVMEYVEGRPLRDLVPHDGLAADVVIRYAIQIADALAHAHQRGIVHRDLKAANVVITPEGRAKVLDFGLSKRLPTEELSEAQTRTKRSLTEAGQVVGTLHYLAPESLRGEPADVRTDIWALGVLLHNMASGELPFEGKTRYEVTAAILGQPPAPLPERVPAGLRAIIQRCLAKEPSQRYQQANEVRAVLEALHSGSDVVPPAPARPSPARRRLVLLATMGATVLVFAAAIATRFVIAPTEIDSVAVLPFSNVGGDPNTEYASDGIAESLIGSLSQLPRLKVIAFSSVVRYKGRDNDPQTIGRELKVAAVVTGRVEWHGDLLVIRADLVDATDGRELWGQKFSRKTSDLMSMQDDISGEISSNLRHSLTDEERKRVVKHATASSEAYELYLKGLYYHRKEFTRDTYDKALGYYRQAIDEDPGYTLAYSGLADLYASMAFVGSLPPKEASDRARAAARRAIEIDDTIWEVHVSQAVVAWGFDWDWAGAERECQRAFALSPNASGAYFFCGQCSRALGRFDEAIARMKKAEETDPLSVDTSRSLGITYYWARRYDDAIAQLRRTLELAPQDVQTHEALADVYARKAMAKEAIAALQQTFLLAGDKEASEGLGRDFESLGLERVMRQLNQMTLDGLEESAKTAYVSPVYFAASYAKLGDPDQAFLWLNRAYEERSPWLTYIKTDPAFDGLHSDPRFGDLLRRVGLPLGRS